MSKIKVAIFASGRGSNARALIDYSLLGACNYEVILIISNKKSAGVLDLAVERDIPNAVVKRKDLYHSANTLEILNSHHVDCIALAGFLWLIPANLVQAFPRRILNIHPALLPKYGGKGMYGIHVHRAVAEANDKCSGMTIHYVNEVYDKGDIIFQSRSQLESTDEGGDIAARVLKLEHHFYPKVLNGVCGRLAKQ